MAVADWSTTPNSNQYVGGVFIGENCPPGNVNDAERTIMAEAKAKFDSLDSAVGGPASGALGALTPAANRIPYFTGPTAAALAPLTTFGLGLLNIADAASLATAIGAVRVLAYSPGVNGYASLSLAGVGLILQWGSFPGYFTEGPVTVGFNVNFPTACWLVLPTANTPNASNTNDFGVQLIDGTTNNSNFGVEVQQMAGSGSHLSGINWIAVGN